MFFKEKEENNLFTWQNSNGLPGNKEGIYATQCNVNKQEMDQKKQKIFWHGKELQMDMEPWEENEDNFSNESAYTLFSNICTPGPKAEPPFEVEILYNLFLFKDGKETSAYAIKIASLCSSWILIKRIDEIVSLILSLKKKTEILSKLSLKAFSSIAPENQEERLSTMQLVFSTILNNPHLQVHMQNFVLTGAYSIEELEAAGVEKLVEKAVGEENGVYLVEYKGWLHKWRCGFFQLHNHILTRTSISSGRVTETIDITKSKISISGGALVIQKEEEEERSLIPNDINSLSRIKKWFAMDPCE
ncbi:hypothetical protein NEFER03_0336 [Nematocida sp. LUAm3]|nr:hypothetical protein NEFER03_0336 [Nematocida sp. LUAm3]KAI5173788.1 hypothetical protein NEFER02_0304 [Nematocida sp. LUAm2]KAI5177011.1 hypothetical protein NEFER01_0336 [Nematocida sp. LUAm1]